jgi:hypothetical protein
LKAEWKGIDQGSNVLNRGDDGYSVMTWRLKSGGVVRKKAGYRDADNRYV